MRKSQKTLQQSVKTESDRYAQEVGEYARSLAGVYRQPIRYRAIIAVRKFIRNLFKEI